MSINNINDLRLHLAKQLEAVAAGEITPSNANATANLAGKMMATVKMELEHAKVVGYKPSIPFLDVLGSEPQLEHQAE